MMDIDYSRLQKRINDISMTEHKDALGSIRYMLDDFLKHAWEYVEYQSCVTERLTVLEHDFITHLELMGHSVKNRIDLQRTLAQLRDTNRTCNETFSPLFQRLELPLIAMHMECSYDLYNEMRR
jgi:hypothetical protein